MTPMSFRYEDEPFLTNVPSQGGLFGHLSPWGVPTGRPEAWPTGGAQPLPMMDAIPTDASGLPVFGNRTAQTGMWPPVVSAQMANTPAAAIDSRFGEPPQTDPLRLLEQLRPMISQVPASPLAGPSGQSPFAPLDFGMLPQAPGAPSARARAAPQLRAKAAGRNPLVNDFENAPEQRRLLNAIAAGEAKDYNIVYGGSTFDSYERHPRRYVRIDKGPNEGLHSSAAGRYQFIFPTWNGLAKELGLQDFSPESQDRAAWHLAAKTYAQKTKRNLLDDLREGRYDDVGWALKSQWTSLPGGIEPNAATNRFTQRLRPTDR